MWCPDVEKMSALVKENEHIWDRENEFYSKESLGKSTLEETAGTLPELVPSVQGVAGED